MAQLDIDELYEVTQPSRHLSSDLIAPSTRNAVRSSTVAVASAAANCKPGRNFLFTKAEDSIIALEVAATEAYLVAYGEVRARYQHAADNANRSPAISFRVKGKYSR